MRTHLIAVELWARLPAAVSGNEPPLLPQGNRAQHSPVPELSFLPAPSIVGAEPGRAEEESRITFMCMLRTPPFPPPNRG